MTISQIEKIGIETDKWVSLPELTNFQFSNDGHLYPSNTTQFFFESDTGLIFVRYFVNPTTLIPGGKVDESNYDIGRYHDVFDLTELVSVQ